MKRIPLSITFFLLLGGLLLTTATTAMPLPPSEVDESELIPLGTVQVGYGVMREGLAITSFDPVLNLTLDLPEFIVPEFSIVSPTLPPGLICSCAINVIFPVNLLPPLITDPGAVALPSSLMLSGFGLVLLLLRHRRPSGIA